MSRTEVKLSQYTCDGCQKIVHVDETIDPPPNGWHGTVRYIDDLSGGEPLPWFACKAACIKYAVMAVANHGRD